MLHENDQKKVAVVATWKSRINIAIRHSDSLYDFASNTFNTAGNHHSFSVIQDRINLRHRRHFFDALVK